MSLRSPDLTGSIHSAFSTPQALAQIALSLTLIFGVTHDANAGNEESASKEQNQPAYKSRWQFLVASGKLIPTGTRQHDTRRADITSAQLSYVLRPQLAVTASLGWARSHDLTADYSPKLDVYSYDLGVELRPRDSGNRRTKTLLPFMGIGAGGRSYEYRKTAVEDQHHLAGYLSWGGEVGVRRVQIRLEARNYLTGFKGINDARNRGQHNNLVLMLGLRIVSNSG